MNRGELVSDELVLKIVRQNLVKDNKGWILDGYQEIYLKQIH